MACNGIRNCQKCGMAVGCSCTLREVNGLCVCPNCAIMSEDTTNTPTSTHSTNSTNNDNEFIVNLMVSGFIGSQNDNGL